MGCDDVEPIVEAAAASEALSAEALRHLDECARCQQKLANARIIDAALRDMTPVVPPAAFTTTVMARVRRERWRTEQLVDWGFNIAVAIGVLLIASGVFGLAWASGLIVIGGDMVTLVSAASNAAAERLAREAKTLVLAAALLTMTLGLWWWVESDVSI